ncbi:MAG: MltA domain-containing protein [Acetobacter sp.]|nr:MltA domain-containing protein [Acetobacter sp.]
MLRRILLSLVILLVASCRKDEVEVAPVKNQQFELQESSFSVLKNWKNEKLDSFDIPLKDVCNVMLKKTAKSLQSEYWGYSLDVYKKHCKKMLEFTDNNELKNYIENNFTPYLVKANGHSEGKFTSYYEAELRASFERGGKYQYPIYGKPKDLIEINLRDFDTSLPNQRLVGRVKNGKLVKYYTRREVDEGKIDAPIILWGDDLVDIYIMQIQGAAVATLPDGKQVRVGYADNNGHRFRGIGSILLEKGLIKSGEASMSKIRQWLKNNGESAKKNMLLNDRYIFHKIVEAEGPIGAMGLPLVAGRSLAVDRTYIPLGSIMWLETSGPDGEALHKLIMAEDIGSAIKGGVRGDYFWGHGEDALNSAGRMNSKGRYFVLLPKDAEVKIYGR